VPSTEQQEGTGLGLSIVRQIVSLMHGEISLESEVGRGSTFCVTLPRDPDKSGPTMRSKPLAGIDDAGLA
jgi:signal transduction histidine kinase